MNLKLTATVLFSAFLLGSCTDDLDQTNPATAANPSVEELYSNPESYLQTLAKLYGGLATTGQQGPAGQPDITGVDEGASQYIRAIFYLNELTTDEALIGWNDNTIKDFHYHTWSSNDGFINGAFSRLDFQIKNCNEYLRQTSDEKLDSRGVNGALREEIAYYRAEARFLRALSYWHFLDFFGGRIGIVTENDPTTYFLPQQATAQELFDFIDAELTAIAPLMKAPRTNAYPRADQAAAWMLHSKLYLNAQVYTGVSKYTEAMPLLSNIINAGYTLNPTYGNLFLADNDRNGSQSENIFSVAFDGLNTQTYGGTTFLVHAPIGGSMDITEFGVNGGWGGVRTTPQFVSKFTTTADQRSNFHTDGQTLEISDISNFGQGYAVKKFKNVDINGNQGSDSAGDFVDTDFPMFRLADVYLMYAECAVRTGQNLGDALTYVNRVRQRAYNGTNAGNIGASGLTLNFLIDERARELHFEGHRRTDLIRFGRFTGGTYIWAFKGNTPAGSPTPSFRNVFPIPTSALAANPTLTQNRGY